LTYFFVRKEGERERREREKNQKVADKGDGADLFLWGGKKKSILWRIRRRIFKGRGGQWDVKRRTYFTKAAEGKEKGSSTTNRSKKERGP